MAKVKKCPKCGRVYDQYAVFCTNPECKESLMGVTPIESGDGAQAGGSTTAASGPNAPEPGHPQATVRLKHAALGRLECVDVPEAKYEVLDGSVIGRTGSINVSMLPRADVISREHCRFHGNAGRCTMEVLKPVNGTYLNNQPLPPGAVVPLSDGDRVTLANTTFVFRVVQ